VVLLTWTPHGGGAHLFALLSPFSLFLLSLTLPCSVPQQRPPARWPAMPDRQATLRTTPRPACAVPPPRPIASATSRPCVSPPGRCPLGCCGALSSALPRPQRREERERRGRGGLTDGPHRHVASTSAKPHSKPPGCLNVTGFESWMVKDIRF
jgi:hypothetical protein